MQATPTDKGLRASEPTGTYSPRRETRSTSPECAHQHPAQGPSGPRCVRGPSRPSYTTAAPSRRRPPGGRQRTGQGRAARTRLVLETRPRRSSPVLVRAGACCERVGYAGARDRVAPRHGDANFGATSLAVMGVGVAIMGVSDCLDDRQPEADAATAAADVRAAEAFEGVLEEGCWEARAVVADAQLDGCAAGAGGDRNRVAGMADRIVEKIPEGLLESDAITGDGQVGRRGCLEVDAGVLGAPGVAGGDGVEKV